MKTGGAGIVSSSVLPVLVVSHMTFMHSKYRVPLAGLRLKRNYRLIESFECDVTVVTGELRHACVSVQPCVIHFFIGVR